MFLSYIIPLYNCEQYLPRCLDSLLRQGIDPNDYEVVIVNDGSTDASRDVAMRYCRAHGNIRLVDQPNSGVGAARNHGIDVAKGDFVMFIDADDWLLDDGVRQLRAYIDADKPCDVYTFWSHTVDSKYDMASVETVKPHSMLLCGTFREHAEQIGFGWSSCMKIISRHLLIDRGVRFSGHKVGEDLLFMTTLYDKAPDATITATSLNIYRYYVHPKSAVNKIDREYNLSVCRGYIGIFKTIKEISDHKIYSQNAYDAPLNDCRLKVFTRMISGVASHSDILVLQAETLKHGILPVPNPVTRIHRIINATVGHSWTLYVMAKFYQKIFLPYIKPRIGRN